MFCTHFHPEKFDWCDVEVSPFGDTERQLVGDGGRSACEDLSIGRFRCTLCREVMYYTGLWRAYYEYGIPCFGSEGVPRELPA